MDPYLEHSALWPDFHNSLVIAIRDSLAPLLRPRYYMALGTSAVLDIEVPMRDEVGENFLEVHEVSTGKVVTILELLSPANKIHSKGREEYEAKRAEVFASRTNLVEVDLLRTGDPMPLQGVPVGSDYRILVSSGARRPRARLYAFRVRDPIPRFNLPLLPEDHEPEVDLNAILGSLYDRAGFDLRLDYSQPPVPPLGAEDAAWARGLIDSHSN
jgi:uncharacterized protein DUF4058